MNDNHEVTNIFHYYSDEKLEEIVNECLRVSRAQTELLHLALAEKARRTLGVNRYTTDDIA